MNILPANSPRPVIITDTREQTPLAFTRLSSQRGTLQTGDYSFAGGEDLFAVERKSIADLVGCCVGENRERFQRELHRLRGFRFKRLLIVGPIADIESRNYRGNIKPQSVFATLGAIEARFDVPVVFAAYPAAAAAQIESWACWYARELANAAKSFSRPCLNIAAPDCPPGSEMAANRTE